MDYLATMMDFFNLVYYNDIMKYPLKYIFQEKAQEILDVFTDLFNIRIAFFSAEGLELKVGSSKPLCQYCSFLRNELGYDNTCKSLDSKMRNIASETGKTVQYDCHGGMTESITPVYIENALIGFLMIGQFRTSKRPIKTSIYRQWCKNNDNTDIKSAFENTPYYSPDDTKNILKLFNILVDYILYRHMIEIYGSNSLQPLVSFIKNHLEENLDLTEGAKILKQSKSSLSHKFKDITGKSFKKFQIELKLDKADEYFQKQPEMTIREVAFRIGYEDPYYFSRLYKKYRGYPPSAAKKKNNNKE